MICKLRWGIPTFTFTLFEIWGTKYLTFEYEGQGERTIQNGDAVLQVPMIKQRKIAYSDDFEVLEIVTPADFATQLVD